MNLETKIIIYKFTPQVFTLTLWSSWVKIEEEHFWQEINGCAATINFPPLCTSHYYF